MIKKIILLLFLILLSSCDIDKILGQEGEKDNDDINIIEQIGKQGIDKAIDLYNTKTSAS